MRIIILLFCSLFAQAQSPDWVDLQGKIDAAVKVNGTVTIEPRRYIIDKPLIVANWNGKDYSTVTIQVKGSHAMWDMDNRSVIICTFKDAPALSIHRGKGVLIEGVNFQGAYRMPRVSAAQAYNTPYEKYGDTTCRDSRFSPYVGIAIDPFRFNLPPDGGYPTLTEWYRGAASVSGSTGIRIKDVTINNFTGGIITSPNGYTLNAEILTFENIRIGNAKFGIAGCQAQEKMNRVINLAAWDQVHTLFRFNTYGSGHPGHWVIDGVNVAGNVVQLIHRYSSGWYPMVMKNVFAEQISRVGDWQSAVGDRMEMAAIDFRSPTQLGAYPDSHIGSHGVSVANSMIRYNGEYRPVLFKGVLIEGDIKNKAGMINLRYDHTQTIIRQLEWARNITISEDRKAVIYQPGMEIGQTVYFMNTGNWEIHGMGEVDSIMGSYYRVKYISHSIKNGTYRMGVRK